MEEGYPHCGGAFAELRDYCCVPTMPIDRTPLQNHSPQIWVPRLTDEGNPTMCPPCDTTNGWAQSRWTLSADRQMQGHKPWNASLSHGDRLHGAAQRTAPSAHDPSTPQLPGGANRLREGLESSTSAMLADLGGQSSDGRNGFSSVTWTGPGAGHLGEDAMQTPSL